MSPFTMYDGIHRRREQALSNFAAGKESPICGLAHSKLSSVSLFSWLLLPKYQSKVKRDSGRRPSNGVFHFSRIHRGDSLPLAMTRHQHFLFSQLHLRPKKTVLALFCGNGAITEQLVQFSDVNVVGIDTDACLVSRTPPLPKMPLAHLG